MTKLKGIISEWWEGVAYPDKEFYLSLNKKEESGAYYHRPFLRRILESLLKFLQDYWGILLPVAVTILCHILYP